MLLCTVRGCRRPLTKTGLRCVCPAGHSFDIARSGYINLLQPQDRRSKKPGDTDEIVRARRRLYDLSLTQAVLDSIADLAAAGPADTILDAGCGEGFYLGSIAVRSAAMAHGIDISVPAIHAAARRYPQCEWIVANADRFIPYEKESFSLILSITGRMNPPEFRRVIRPEGRLLVAVAAPDDLAGVRGIARDRTERTIADFAPQFVLADQRRASTTVTLGERQLEDVRQAIYRPGGSEPARQTSLTFSLDLMLFRPL